MKLGGPDADLEGTSELGLKEEGIEEGSAPGLEEALGKSLDATEEHLGGMMKEGAQTDELED